MSINLIEYTDQGESLVQSRVRNNSPLYNRIFKDGASEQMPDLINIHGDRVCVFTKMDDDTRRAEQLFFHHLEQSRIIWTARGSLTVFCNCTKSKDEQFYEITFIVSAKSSARGL